MAAAGRADQNDEPLVETLHAAIEARGGRQLKVVFAAEGQPALLFKPGAGSWNWSATSKLVIPIDNPGDAVVALLLRVASDPERSLSGKVAIAPHSMCELAIRIDAPPPRAMGMIAGPTLAAGGLEPGLLPVTATEGSVDASHVASVRLGISRPTAPRHLVIGPLRAEPPSTADKSAYDGIVDGFGQFRHGTWPEKISSVGVLRARGAEEALELIGWLAHAPKRDRFGGLDTGGSFRATGLFRTERRAGRWWLVTPDGNPFFTIGMDVVALSGSIFVDGREFMFRELPERDGELAAHWSERDDRRGLGAQRGRAFDHGHAFNFYTANLERKFSADWRPRWREEALTRLEAWGFNTIGNWSRPELWAMHRLPFTVPLSARGQTRDSKLRQ